MTKYTLGSLFLIMLVCGGLLSACGSAVSEANAVTPPAQPCLVVEGQKGLIGGDKPAPLILDPKSPAYCLKAQDDYKATMQWYQAQLKNNVYPPNLIADLGNYYTGPLLNQARNGIFYNQQAGRVVVGRWTAGSEQFAGQEWPKDGRSTTLTVRVPGYQTLTFPTNQPQQARIEKSSPLEAWVVKLVYDDKAGRWKIQEANNVYAPGVGG